MSDAEPCVAATFEYLQSQFSHDPVVWGDLYEPTQADLDVLHAQLAKNATASAQSFWASYEGKVFQRAAVQQRNGSTEAAEALCRKFAAFRQAVGWPLRLSAMDAPTALSSGMHVLCPEHFKSPEGYPIILYDCARLDVSACAIEEYQMMGCFLMECLLYGDTPFAQRVPEKTQTLAGASMESDAAALNTFNGIVWLIVDAACFGLSNLTDFSIEDVRRGISMWQGAFPVKLRKIFVVNCGMIMTPLFQAACALLAPKLRERIVVVNDDFEQLHRHIMPANLPPSLGGTWEIDWQRHVEECCPSISLMSSDRTSHSNLTVEEEFRQNAADESWRSWVSSWFVTGTCEENKVTDDYGKDGATSWTTAPNTMALEKVSGG